MGKTILISSHILHELAQLCTRIGIIEAGKMITEGSLEEIYHSLGLLQMVHAQILNLSDDVVRSIERIPGVEDVQQVPVDSLSRGMKQRLALARVLLHDPFIHPDGGLELTALSQ